MKKLILILGITLFTITGFLQATPTGVIRISDASTAFEQNIPIGKQVYNIETNELWVATQGIINTATLTSASGSFSLINGSGSTNLSEGSATSTTVVINSNTGNDATLNSASTSRAGLLSKAKFDEIATNSLKTSNISTSLSVGTINSTTIGITSDGGVDDVIIPAATGSTAGVLTTAKWAEIVTNSLKTTNANHSGDVSGSLVLTIGNDKVDKAHINWGTGASQVSTADIPEQTNLFYTDARVTLNSSVVSNSAKTGISPQQTADIITNNSKISYTDAAQVSANTSKVSNATHSGDVTGSTTLTIGSDRVDESHINWGTSASQISTNDIPEQTNLFYTDIRVAANPAVAANTAKVSDINHNTDTQNLSQSGNTITLVDGGSVNVSTTTAVAANTAKTGISTSQANAIINNTAKNTNVSTQLTLGTRTTTTIPINSDGSTSDIILPSATGSLAGLMSSSQYNKLSGISSSAQANYNLKTDKFEENDGTPTAHSLTQTAITTGCTVSLNGAVLQPLQYTFTSATITIALAVAQYDQVTITYNY